MRRLIWRTIRRVAGRTEFWDGNRERWRNLLTWDQQESVISWAWHHYPIYRERYIWRLRTRFSPRPGSTGSAG